MQKVRAVLMSADVADFARLVSIDENVAISQLGLCRDILLDHIRRFGGQVVNTATEGVLAIFPGAVEAVRCAIAAQDDLSRIDTKAPAQMRPRFRIGLAVGEVVEVDGTLLGAGVTMVHKLQSIAPPGGIAAMASVRDGLDSAVQARFSAAGDFELKAGMEPEAVFVIAGGAERPSAPTRSPARKGAMTPEKKPAASYTVPLVGTGMAAAVVIAVGSLWLFDRLPVAEKPIVGAQAKGVVAASPVDAADFSRGLEPSRVPVVRLIEAPLPRPTEPGSSAANDPPPERAPADAAASRVRLEPSPSQVAEAKPKTEPAKTEAPRTEAAKADGTEGARPAQSDAVKAAISQLSKPGVTAAEASSAAPRQVAKGAPSAAKAARRAGGDDFDIGDGVKLPGGMHKAAKRIMRCADGDCGSRIARRLHSALEDLF
jgi:adenylate cyclase